MATRLKNFPQPRAGTRPWDKWLDGNVWKVPLDEADVAKTNADGTKRTDTERLDLFRRFAYIAAGRRGLKVRTSRDDDANALVIQAIGTREETS